MMDHNGQWLDRPKMIITLAPSLHSMVVLLLLVVIEIDVVQPNFLMSQEKFEKFFYDMASTLTVDFLEK